MCYIPLLCLNAVNLFSAMSAIDPYSSLIYFYAVFSVMVVIFYTVFRDRGCFSSASFLLVFLSFMLLLSAGLLVVLSFGDGSSSGWGSVRGGVEVRWQPWEDVLQGWMLSLVPPSALLVVVVASYLVATGFSCRALDFDAACVLLCGSLLVVFFLVGMYPVFGLAFTGIALVLSVLMQNYRGIIGIIMILYLIGAMF
jgi:hypothetical protein